MEKEKRIKKQKTLRKNKRSRFITVAIIIAAIIVILVLAAVVIRLIGKNALYNGANSKTPSIEQDDYTWQEGWIRYNDEIYAYNEDIMTFLVMGIDKEGKVKESKSLTDGGQSDAIFLLVFNPHTEEISIISVDRNTMTDIRMVGVGTDGTDVITQAQINVQHGFGDGEEESCELTKEAVSSLFFDLPIHGYISFNYGAVPVLNDAVGGVEVTVPEGITKYKPEWNVGEKVRLKGEDAVLFVQWREPTEFESARVRTLRQKEYLAGFVQQAIEATKSDLSVPITLYNEVKQYTVTDISVDEMTYLIPEVINYSFSDEQIYTMAGETVMGDEFEEFYPDMDALKEQVIEIFYEKVDAENEK